MLTRLVHEQFDFHYPKRGLHIDELHQQIEQQEQQQTQSLGLETVARTQQRTKCSDGLFFVSSPIRGFQWEVCLENSPRAHTWATVSRAES